MGRINCLWGVETTISVHSKRGKMCIKKDVGGKIKKMRRTGKKKKGVLVMKKSANTLVNYARL